MKFFSEGGVSSLALEIVEAETSYFPSFHLQISVSDPGFTASSMAWVAVDAVQAFAKQLRQCRIESKGHANLSRMSPGELELRLEPSDALGHSQVNYRVGRQSLSNGGWQETVLTGGFDLDVQFLEQTVEAVELMAP